MAELVQIWENEILPRLDLCRLLANLTPKATGGNVQVTCPQCGVHEAFIKNGRDSIKCNRGNNCGERTPLLTYLNGGTMPTGRQWVDLVRGLGLEVGVSLPERELSPEQIKQYEEKKQYESELERTLDQARKALQNAPEAIAYLTKDRGFKPERLSQLEIGWNDQPLEEKDAWKNRIIFPLRDRHGSLIALAGRALNWKKGDGPKFIKSQGYDIKNIALEGLDVAKKYKNIVVGESTIGVFSFREAGFPEMTGIGGSHLSADRWKKLTEYGIESVTLALDPDKAGIDGTISAIEEALKTAAPDIYVIQHEQLKGLDPDEFLRKHGAEAWKEILVNKITADQHMARAYASQFDLTTAVGYHAYLEKCARYLAQRCAEPKGQMLAMENFFRQGVQTFVKVDEDEFFEYMVMLKTEQKEKRLKEKLVATQDSLRDAANKLDIKKAKQNLSTALQELQQVDLYRDLKPLVVTAQRLPEHDKFLQQMTGKTSLGLLQKTIPTLDEATSGARGLIAIGGGPGGGKTTFAVNILVDILRNNPDTCGIVVSLEMHEEEILTRIKSRALGTPYDKLLLRSTDEMRQEANAAIRDIVDRLFIIDEEVYPAITTDLLIRDSSRLMSETKTEKIVVVIDYLQLWPLPDEIEGRPELEQDKWLAKQMKLLRKELWPNPVIFISEISKVDGFKATGLHSIKGSSRIVFAADSVVLLNAIDEGELLDRIECTGKSFRLKQTTSSRYKRKPAKKKDDEETEKLLEMFLDEMERQGKTFVDVTIPKVRGGKRKSFTLSFRHTCSDLKEITVNGEGF